MSAKLLAQRLAETERKVRAIYVGTYIPRECGIATFTKDLTTSINMLNPENLAEIIAINESGAEYNYPWEVKYRIDQNDKNSYISAAEYINQSSCEIVNIQHEFGIYGGKNGEYLSILLDKINKPIVTTLHTVLSKPSIGQKKIVRRIAKKSKALIVMIPEAAERLAEEYGIPIKKIVVIPHGVPDIPFSPSTPHKKQFKLTKKMVISTFGLLSSGKGIEYAIKAIPEVAKDFKDFVYLIIGQTHPVILKQEGEKYRKSLEKLVKKLKIKRHVKFVNKYVNIDELISYLQATDIYVTPYLNPEQITSGTLAYAVGAGKPCISTAYIYAKSVLSKGRGCVVPLGSEGSIADKIKYLLANKETRIKIAKKAYLFGRSMTWQNVALKYLDLFGFLVKKNSKKNELQTIS